MMQMLQLKGYSKARVWLDETPSQAVLLGAVERLYSSVGGQIRLLRRVAAVEWHIPMGPRSLYGLLGIEYSPQDGRLLIEIINEIPQRQCEDTLTSRVSDNALIGLPMEYRTAVVKGILSEATAFTGRLLVTAAVIGEVNSCEAIFENLGRIVTALLCTSGELPESEFQSLLIYRQPQDNYISCIS